MLEIQAYDPAYCKGNGVIYGVAMPINSKWTILFMYSYTYGALLKNHL